MNNHIKNLIHRISKIQNIEEKILVSSTSLGAVGGAISNTMYNYTSKYGKHKYNLENYMFSSISGGLIGGTFGLLVGLTLPLTLPCSIVGGGIGLGIYAYNEIKTKF